MVYASVLALRSLVAINEYSNIYHKYYNIYVEPWSSRYSVINSKLDVVTTLRKHFPWAWWVLIGLFQQRIAAFHLSGQVCVVELSCDWGLFSFCVGAKCITRYLTPIMYSLYALLAFLAISQISGEVYFEENFNDSKSCLLI